METQTQAALRQMALGNFAAATQAAQSILQATPDAPDALLLAGALELHTGEIAKAQAAFEHILSAAPHDALALYGRGLAKLAQGSRQAALEDFAKSVQQGGDADILKIARAYAEWPDAKMQPGKGVPPGLLGAAQAIMGMRLARQGANQQAIRALGTALNRLSVGPVLGLRMTFDTAHPFAFAPRPVLESLPDTNTAKLPALSGDVRLAPREISPSAAYASFEIDGQSVGLVNVAPYQMTWDSRKTANGLHTLCVRCYDSDGNEISAAKRTLRLLNQIAAEVGSDDGRETVRTSLWQILTPGPDSTACTYAMGIACRAAGGKAEAKKWLWRTAAQQPDYRNVRKELAALDALPAPQASLYGGLPSHKEIALTFDDGPKPGITEPLLDLLVQQHAPSTFFVIGRNVALFPELTRQIAASGMELANHSYTHRSLIRLSSAEVAREMAQTQAEIGEAAGVLPRYMRPPGGNWNANVERAVRQWGLTPCFWTVDVYGSEVVGSQDVAKAVLAQVRPGAIVLMHNGKMNTLQALPEVLRELKKRGYTFVTVSTLAQHLREGKAAERQAVQAKNAAHKRHKE